MSMIYHIIEYNGGDIYIFRIRFNNVLELDRAERCFDLVGLLELGAGIV